MKNIAGYFSKGSYKDHFEYRIGEQIKTKMNRLSLWLGLRKKMDGNFFGQLWHHTCDSVRERMPK